MSVALREREASVWLWRCLGAFCALGARLRFSVGVRLGATSRGHRVRLVPTLRVPHTRHDAHCPRLGQTETRTYLRDTRPPASAFVPAVVVAVVVVFDGLYCCVSYLPVFSRSTVTNLPPSPPFPNLCCFLFEQVIDVKTKGILRAFREHKAPTRAVRWSCDGLQLASGSDDKTVRLWDLPTSTALQVPLVMLVSVLLVLVLVWRCTMAIW